MAKKRVHEIAKQRGIPSKEVITILQRAGLDVKTAAQSVDENDIALAFSNGGKGPTKEQVQQIAEERAQQVQQRYEQAQRPGGVPRPGQPAGRPGGAPVQGQRPGGAAQGQGGAPAQSGGQNAQENGGQQQRSVGGGRAKRPSRPTRGIPPGRQPGAGGPHPART